MDEKIIEINHEFGRIKLSLEARGMVSLVDRLEDLRKYIWKLLKEVEDDRKL